jgi:methionyl-tRNA formyltransferase
MNNYVVATIKSWNIDAFHQRTQQWEGNWHLFTEKDQLTIESLRKINPRYIFFPHWSWLVPNSILTEFNCICFHMTDLPYGRGGSPLQNLIIRGHNKTKLSALKMSPELDAGPIYLKEPLSLEGSATDIFKRATETTFDMIDTIITFSPSPTPQQGEMVKFARRTPAQSELNPSMSLEEVFNTIRMLDAESYPKAFIELGNIRFELSDVYKSGNELKATVTIQEKSEKNAK